MTKPIFRLFQLGLDLAYQADSDQVGRHNLSQSIDLEPGTLAMFANHLDTDPSQQIVVEIYQDQAAYQAHVASSHFKAFADFAARGLTDRQMISLDPQILLSKQDALRQLEQNDLAVRLAILKVANHQAFSDIVLPEMRTSMEVEEGVLVMLAGRDANDLDTWYFYEIYASQAAYESHCQTKHFKDYLTQSQPLVLDKSLHSLKGDILVTKGGTYFDPEA